ncbi:Smr/MutS family protein [Candidatus Raskinella chloraquaticus]|uniref:Smr domain-containing protein n=1 Tax=Candidatus Raskinella chloraquaticus TaxID=1951219 RepID=A0A1W9HYF3_9HYPH|nr:MAG: hypothetical protein A4S15_06580 [Proteobacteria bacterium SG_bin8]
MPSRPPRPPPKDHAVWDVYTEQVTPLHPRVKRMRQPTPPKVAPAPLDGPPATAPPPLPVGKPIAAPLPTELDRLTRRRVRRGDQAIDERIDLHGLTQVLAHRQLLTFLQSAQARGARLVMVITGKGRSDGDGEGRGTGVLRRAVPLWLEEPAFRVLVVAVSSAARLHGGEGALYLRLRRPRQG